MTFKLSPPTQDVKIAMVRRHFSRECPSVGHWTAKGGARENAKGKGKGKGGGKAGVKGSGRGVAFKGSCFACGENRAQSQRVH